MTRAEVCREYEVDTSGVIRSPGKFQSSPVWAPHFWEMVLNGFGGDTIHVWGTAYDWIEVSAEDRAEYPELAEIPMVVVWETDNGFANVVPSTAAEREAMEREAAESAEGDE